MKKIRKIDKTISVKIGITVIYCIKLTSTENDVGYGFVRLPSGTTRFEQGSLEYPVLHREQSKDTVVRSS